MLLSAGESLLSPAARASARAHPEGRGHRRPPGGDRARRLCRDGAARGARGVELPAVDRSREGRGADFEATASRRSPTWSRARALRLESVALELGLDDARFERAFPAALRAKVRAADPRGARARDRAGGDRGARAHGAAARRDARAGARLGARVRGEGGAAARRAHPPPRRGHPGVVHHDDGRARLLRALDSRAVRRPRARQPRDGPHHRGALARVARRRGLADHAAGDPHQGAAPGRHARRRRSTGCRSSRRAR